MATWEQNPVYMNTAYADMIVSHDSTLRQCVMFISILISIEIK